ncbi:MAG: hypothetical protein ACF8Q5_09410 [Phycisphaerales bacterium JB040]
MADEMHTPDRGLNNAELIRAGADGELSAPDVARLEALQASDPTVSGRMAFERELRGACCRAMSGACCPDALRSRVEAMASARGDLGAGEQDPGGHGDRGPSVIEALSPATRDRAFWTGSRRLMAVAAVALFGLAGVLIWQSASLSGASGPVPAGRVTTATFRQELAEFVTREHRRTSESERAATSKFVHTDPEEARAWFRELLGDQVRIMGLEQPVESIAFKGAGRCGVPGAGYGESAHMRFEVSGEDGSPVVVSVFVAPASDRLRMEVGTTYAVDMNDCGIDGYTMLAWTDGTANYYLVADAATKGCLKTLEAIGQPEPTGSI